MVDGKTDYLEFLTRLKQALSPKAKKVSENLFALTHLPPNVNVESQNMNLVASETLDLESTFMRVPKVC
jgi:hypothetical protein